VNLPDTNLWLALALSKHEFHSIALDWFARQSEEGSVLFCRSTQQSVLRLVTTEAVMRLYALPPMTNDGAWDLYEGFLADRRISWASEPRGLESRWKGFAARSTASPKLWMDAYLAAFAMAGGHQLVTTDKAFTQFAGLDHHILSKP
jgi:uncharacterized protein